jgi:hypothetical protein
MMELQTYRGDLFWNSKDTENTVDSPEDELDNVGEGNIVKFDVATREPDMYGVLIAGKARFFATLAEAEEAVRIGG